MRALLLIPLLLSQVLVPVSVQSAQPSPWVEIVSPHMMDNTGRNVTVVWRGNAERYTLSLDQGEWIDAGKGTSYTFENLSEGLHSVAVVAEIGYETASAVVEFVVNLTPPKIERIRIYVSSEWNAKIRSACTVVYSQRVPPGNITLVFDSDKYPLIVNVELREGTKLIDSRERRIGGYGDFPMNYTLPQLNNGSYRLFLRVRDLANNTRVFELADILVNATSSPTGTSDSEASFWWDFVTGHPSSLLIIGGVAMLVFTRRRGIGTVLILSGLGMFIFMEGLK